MRLGPRSPNRIATDEAITLLEALGRSIGLVPVTVSERITSHARTTVSTLPSVELATTPVEAEGTVSASAVAGPSPVVSPASRRAASAAQ